MERGYRRIICRYPNSEIRVMKTCYPYGTKLRGLSDRKQLIDLLCNSNDWFLCDDNFGF